MGRVRRLSIAITFIMTRLRTLRDFFILELIIKLFRERVRATINDDGDGAGSGLVIGLP
jgi:hypothetical protein